MKVKVVCDGCKGTGKVKMPHDIEVSCLFCQGKGWETKTLLPTKSGEQKRVPIKLLTLTTLFRAIQEGDKKKIKQCGWAISQEIDKIGEAQVSEYIIAQIEPSTAWTTMEDEK